jgi:hypothetical protein
MTPMPAADARADTGTFQAGDVVLQSGRTFRNMSLV